jgi:hypothetical protein
VYPVERSPQESFAWTASSATITLRGVDRDTPWRCTVRMRGARPAGLPEPEAAIGIDGITMRTESAGAEYREIDVDAPPSPRSKSLSLTIQTTPTFVPGPSDRRELGVQVDAIRCSPSNGARVAPPSAALIAAAFAGAAFGALFAVLLSALAAAASTGLLAGALAFVLDTGMAAYSPAYVGWIVPLAGWIAGPVLIAALVSSSRRPLHPAGAFVLAFSSAVLFLKIVALLHPSKDVVDALFQAHRFDAVLAGNYYFTQPMPGGVRFPYAIGLYVTAAPWARLLSDHVALLRIVVCVFEVFAAGLLYVAIARSWNDRLSGAAAVVLYYAAPLPYVIIGNANLTFAFAQSVAVLAVVAATILPFQRRWLLSTAVLTATAGLGFLSHVGVFPVLAVTLVALASICAWPRRRDLRTASGVLGATALAAVLAIGSYYAHFPEVWRTLDRVRTPAVEQTTTAPPAPMAANPPLSISARALRAAALCVRAYGLPLFLLALPGVWLVLRDGRDRLTLALAAWGIALAVFLAFRIIAPVDVQLQRYADEFIDRLYYFMLPGVAVLAARAAASGWRAGSAIRWIGLVVVFSAAALGVEQWVTWMR